MGLNGCAPAMQDGEYPKQNACDHNVRFHLFWFITVHAASPAKIVF
jgi:hypothetical protein